MIFECNLTKSGIAKIAFVVQRHYRFAILITILSLFCFSCSTASFLRVNLKNNETEFFSKEPFPYKMSIPYGDWNTKWKGYQMAIFSSKSNRAKQINLVINQIDNMPYYKKGDTGKSILLKHFKWDEDFYTKFFGEVSCQIISENINGPLTPNLLFRMTEKYTEAFVLLMIKDNYILGLTSQDFKNSSDNKQIVLDIFKTIKFISEEEFELEDRKCTNCR